MHRKGSHAALEELFILKTWLVCAVKVLVVLSAVQQPTVSAQLEPGQALVSGTNITFLDTPEGTTYVVRNHTVFAGKLLVEGTLNVQPNITACAASCDRLKGCTGFNWCGMPGGCLADPSGTRRTEGFCQLVEASMALGVGVFQLASDNPLFTAGGLRTKAEYPGPLPGYEGFYGQSLLYLHDKECQDTMSDGKCVLPMPLPEAKAYCDATPECKGFGFLPNGLDQLNYTEGPIASFKFLPEGELVNMNRVILTGVLTLYIKQGQMGRWAVEASGSSDNGTLSAGAIAGIVIGAVCACTMILVVAVLLLRRHQRGYPPPESFKPNTLEQSSSEDPEVGELGGVQGKHTSGSYQGKQSKSETALYKQLELYYQAAAGDSQPSNCSGSYKAGITSCQSSSSSALLMKQKEDMLLPRSEIEIVKDKSGNPMRLGRGAFGNVYRAVLHGATTCACKVFQLGGDPRVMKHFSEEAQMLWTLNHPHIVTFLGASVTETEGLLLMEYMRGGDLSSRMHTLMPDGRSRVFAWENKGQRIALQVAVGLAYLHRQKIAHMDLKPRNVLLSREGECKIGDVGFSRVMSGDFLSSVGSRMGTFEYIAPEILLGQPANLSADIFSYGVLLWALCTGEEPRRGFMRQLEAPRDCPTTIVELQQRCCSINPQERPSAAEVIEGLHCAKRSLEEEAKAAAAAAGAQGGSGALFMDGVASCGSDGLPKNGSSEAGTLVRTVRIESCELASPWMQLRSPLLSQAARPTGTS